MKQISLDAFLGGLILGFTIGIIVGHAIEWGMP